MHEVNDDRIGTGNWEAFRLPIDEIVCASASWKAMLKGIDHPWLCWNVSPAWCELQQRLVKEVGWTPVVGGDSRAGTPPIVPGSIYIDFFQGFDFPLRWFHFVIEFVHLFAPRLAFWHSDLLCRIDVMRYLSQLFSQLKDGQTAAVWDPPNRRSMLNPRRYLRRRRYWELVGCTTAGASLSQYQCGSGWWRHIECHPAIISDRERNRRSTLNYEHGVGIFNWKQRCGGVVVDISRRLVEEGHCTSINNPSYKRVTHGTHPVLTTELDLNYNLSEVAKKLEIDHLL